MNYLRTVTNDHLFMKRALELAALGLGTASPNPLVGCVIVYDNTIIGEGHHAKSGFAHAEVNAIESVKDRTQLAQATLYVTLEPCSHFGKTPPCVDRILKEKIPAVVICNLDPFAEVNGRGIKLLQDNGVDVRIGILEEEGRKLNRRFFTSIEKSRPYVILKWAKSRDGFMDIDRKQGEKGSYSITSSYTQKFVHKWRSEEDAILVGLNTIITDNPELTTRYYSGKNPLRVIIDPKGQLDAHYKVFTTDSNVLVYSDVSFASSAVSNPYREFIDMSTDSVGSILESLHRKNIRSLLVEGGRFTLSQFIASQTWDEVRLLTGNKYILTGMPSPDLCLTPDDVLNFNEDLLEIYFNKL